MFTSRFVFVITLLLAFSNGVSALLGPLWHYAMIAEGPEGELSAVPIIAATATVAPYAMVAPSAATPTLVAITPSATPAPTSSVEQSNAVDAPNPQTSGGDNSDSPSTLARTNGGARPLVWGPSILIISSVLITLLL